ncbi:unnamed protein product [Allacma fusca]|uniref:Peptidase S1 domain-containing protein n=1 Tax=Allacma fusca TaxID=39272 RepID=A0A8J2PT91_9HEXA|nr:unnamed protein product [Allacma fusca]
MFIGPENYALARNISSSGYVKVSQGQEARVGQFPHQLLLTTATGYPICGAALITSIFALTAAHCVIGRTPSKLMIQSGRHRRSSDGSNLQKVPVKNMVVHEHYNYKTHSNDIAMLLLSRELNFDAYTSPIHVPINNTRYEEKAQVSGWGRIAEGGPLSDALLWAEDGLKQKLLIISLKSSVQRVYAAAQSILNLKIQPIQSQ